MYPTPIVLIILMSLISSTTSTVMSSDVKIVIIGPTGAGKSSLANVLLGESPLCLNCTFPVCYEGLNSCTKETSMATRPWLGSNELFTVVDTPGFGDSDRDDDQLVDEMMDVLNKDVGSANLILLLIKGTETRLGRELQQMIREMRALFGERMWDNLVIGVSFWSFKDDIVKYRRNTCQWSPSNCKDEQWFAKSMLSILQEKFHIKQDLPFVFLDSWAKHPMNVNDEEQKVKFHTESEKLWSLAKQSKPFKFMTVNDVLEDNHIVKKRNAELEQMIEKDISYLMDSNKELSTNFNNIKLELEKIADNFKINEVKNKETSDLLTKLNSSTTASINVVADKFDMEFKQMEAKISNMENKISKEVSKVDKAATGLNQHLTEIKKDSHSIKKSLETEIQERRNLNDVFRRDIASTKDGLAQLQTKSAVTDRDISFFHKENAAQKSEQKSLKSSVGSIDKNISKLRNRVMTRRNCQSTNWVNDMDGHLNYKCPANKVLVRAESYHSNGTEDRRWKFECCDLILSF